MSTPTVPTAHSAFSAHADPLFPSAPTLASTQTTPSDHDPAAETSSFDVCHGALVWRALLMVNAALFVGALVTTHSPAEALSKGGPLVMAGVVGTVTWLMGVCAASGPLTHASQWQQRVALASWGAVLSTTIYAGLNWMLLDQTTGWHAFGAALVGALLAAVMSIWIEQRTRVNKPAHADARLAELQARIQPHFLFNTLNTATALVRVDPPAAEAMLEDLSDLFRAALNDARTNTLGAEVAVARQYLAIEQRRFGSRLKVDWDLDAAADRAPVPSLVLQPLLENAVRHGVESMRDGAWIRVRTRHAKGQAQVVIENNVGSVTRTGSGMALANVRERLRLMHDLDGRFDTQRDADRFVVRMSVPMKEPA